MTHLEYIQNCKKRNEKLFALLLDPENYTKQRTIEVLQIADESDVDFILIGGSLISEPIDPFVELVKKHTSIPILLFPGSLLQISHSADGILLMSLISGRNPELLIGNHVLAAPALAKSNLEILSTGYILIEGGNTTAVEYMSNTKAIPANKPEIAIATAQAGEMIGMKLIYLEAGSGADKHINAELIKSVSKNISLPIICGGGIKTENQLNETLKAADIVVIGNLIEKDPEQLSKLVQFTHNFQG